MFTTLYTYDTWNRIQTLTYPDGELVTFNYDSGGNIKAIAGQKQANAYNYLTFIGYDKFEARERVALGNGTATSYTYNPLNRRMTNLLAQTKSARTFMNMAYGYDAVGNIKTLANSAAIPASTALYGGTTAYSFGYDDLYQLTSATGAFAKPNVPTQQFTLAMSYDGIHNITHKTQTSFNVWSTGAKTPNLPLTYDWTYAYAGGRPHAASQIGNHAFKYDLDGNQAGWNATNSGQNRVMVWDEDNRLQSVTDSSGQPTTFKYDDGTNRVVKKGAGGETLYINPWYVAALGRNSKQIFAGATRITTKLEQFPSGEGYGTGAKNLTSFYQYFYHPDHLGSTGFVTDATGEVYQHLEYFPFGETWVDEVSDDTRVPYRFTGQEFDPETRLYYFGARYFDPRTSVWQNPDPALGQHLSGRSGGGVFVPQKLALASYAGQNPLRFVDPDGRDWWLHYEPGQPQPTWLWRSPEWMRDHVPGQQTWDDAITAYANGDRLAPAKAIPSMVAEDAATVAGNGTAQLGRVILRNIGKRAVEYFFRRCSFHGSTLVITKKGLKRIDRVQVNELVLAEDEVTGKEDWKPVLDRYQNRYQERVVLTLATARAGRERIISNRIHPFYVKDKGWLRADQLEKGDLVATARNGIFATVVSTQIYRKPLLAYNLKVDGYHTFFVGKSAAWVHNDCDPLRPRVNTGLNDRVTKELPEGEIRTPEENGQARNFFERNRSSAEEWYTKRTGKEWPANATHAEHSRPIKNGGDPLYIEPGFDGPASPHMVPGADGKSDFQRWGNMGGRPPKASE